MTIAGVSMFGRHGIVADRTDTRGTAPYAAEPSYETKPWYRRAGEHIRKNWQKYALSAGVAGVGGVAAADAANAISWPDYLNRQQKPAIVVKGEMPSLKDNTKNADVILLAPFATPEEYTTILKKMKEAHAHNVEFFGEDTFDVKPKTTINLKDRKDVDTVLQWSAPGTWEHEDAHILQTKLFDTSERWYAEGLANYSKTLYGSKSSPLQEGSVYIRCRENTAMSRTSPQKGLEKGIYCGGQLVIENNVLEKIAEGADAGTIYKSTPDLALAWDTGDLFFMLLEQRGLTVENNQKALELLKQMYKSRLEEWGRSTPESRPDKPEPTNTHDIRRAYERALGIDLGDVFSLLGPGIRNNYIQLTKPIEELIGEDNKAIVK